MREILSIQVGQCGNQIASRFWELISAEHGVDPDGQLTSNPSTSNALNNDRISTYFDEGAGTRLVPRAILVDLEPGAVESIRANSKIGRLFRPDNIVNSSDGAGNNWAKGYYTDGRDLIDPIMDCVRREAEKTECLQGFQITHSLGGGTGSGLGGFIMNKLKEEFPDRIVNTFSIYPSAGASDVVVEPYNTVLGVNQLIESADECFTFDNQALLDICFKQLKLSAPTYADLNHLVSHTMGGVTASLRYPGLLNCDLRKLAVNMVPFPRLHFFSTSAAPIVSRKCVDYFSYNTRELMLQIFDDRNLMCNTSLREGKILTAACLFRGAFSTSDVETSLCNFQKKNSRDFVDWIPNNILTGVSNFGVEKKDMKACLIANTSSIQKIFKRENAKFTAMLKRKAFLHHYLAEGMDESEFSEATLNLNDLCDEYQQYEISASEPGDESTQDEIAENSSMKSSKEFSKGKI
jgi:tubulin beta